MSSNDFNDYIPGQTGSSKGGSRRKKARRRLDPARMLKRLFTVVPVNAWHRMQSYTWLCALPLLLLLSITATDFLILTHVSDAAQSLFFDDLPVPFDDSRRDPAEALKAHSLQYVYIFLFFVCLLHWRKVVGYFLAWPHFVLLFAALLIGVLYSVEPVKVITNTILIVVGVLAAVLFASAYARQGRYVSFYHVVFWPMILIHVTSLYILSLYEVSIFEFLASERRYGGLAGNPNSLGATAVLGVWAAAGLLSAPDSRRTFRIVAIAGLSIFFLTTAVSGSGTSIAAILVVLLSFCWLRILAAVQPKTRLVINSILVTLALFISLYAMLITTPGELFISLTDSLGKDATLTGRTELWAIARDAVAQKPYLGWGFDSHQSVMSERTYAVRFNHYHNGYLDTLIAGGVLLFMLVIYNLFRFMQMFLRTFRADSAAFPLLLPFLILLVLNMSEYSLLRPNSQLWQVYIIAFAILTYDPLVDVTLRLKLDRPRENNSSSRPGRRKRNQKLRWA